MINRKAKVEKQHDSDPEDEPEDRNRELAERQVSREEQQAAELENVPVIPDCEVSPAAYIFAATQEQDELNLYEEK